MTQPFDDEHGDRLRRALHAEAEAVTPSAEGLERIRSKINQRHERRFDFFSSSIPWLRPLAAAAAAVFVCVVAVSVTPALANFVQTGHFSPDTGNGGGNPATSDGHTYGEVVPSTSSIPLPGVSPSPTARPSSTGKHVVNGACRPGEETVTPSTTPAPEDTSTSGAVTTVTCRPTGGGTSSAPVTEGPPQPPVTPPAVISPSDAPTQDSGPTTNPNQSP